ncbi:MAG: hypothetical protein RIS17_469 [Pseudomonadota bacterium]
MALIETIPVTGSTNADLAARLRGGERIGEGQWLVAERQTQGRGRQGRDWFEGAGNFMGSTIVRLQPGDPVLTGLPFLAGLAVYEAVAGMLAQPQLLQLKWPNDLMLSGAKLAGILLERVEDAVIVGIGVNLAQAPQLPGRKTAALSNLGPAPEAGAFALRLADSFAEELRHWREYGMQALLTRWLAAAHPDGTPLTVHEQGAAMISGTFAGLEESGALRLRLADGATRVIHAGDVFV